MTFSGFRSGSDGKESICNLAGLGLIPGLGRSLGRAQRGLVGYSPLGHKRVRHDLVTKQQKELKDSADGRCKQLTIE